MAKKWQEVVSNPEYQKLGGDEREAVRNEYFANVVMPNVPTEDLAAVRSKFDEDTAPGALQSIKEAVGAALTPNDAVTTKESSPASVIAKNGIKVPGGKNIVEQAGDMMVSDAYKEAEEQKTNTGEKYDPAQYTPAENYEQQVKLKEFAQKTLSKREADGMQQVADELSGKLEHDPVRSLADSLTSQTEQGKVREETLHSVANDPIDVIGRQYLPGSKVDDVLETARVHESGRQAAIASTKQKAQDSVAYQAVNDTMRGTDNLQSLGGGLLSMGADVLGAPEVRNEFMKIYTRNQREAEEHPAVIGTYKNVHGFGDAGRYAVEAVFENIPMFLPSLVSGGVGAAAARKGAEKLVADMIKARVAKNIPLAIAEKEAAKFIAGRIAIGSAAGAAPSAIGMETGSIYGDIYEKTGEYRPAVALAYGTAAGALDVIPSVMALKKVFGAGLVDQVKKSFVRRYGAEGLKQFSAEAITEGMQTALERLAVQHVDGKQQAFTQQGVDEIIDSMLKGGVGGGTMGVGSQAAADVLDYGNGTVNPSGQSPTAGIPPVQPQDTDAIPAESLLGTPEPEQTSPVVPTAKPAGVLSRAALAAVQQGITPLNQPTAEVSNAQVQPGAANEQPNIGTAGAYTNVLQPQTGNSGENAGVGNGLDPVAGGMDEQGSGQQAGAAAIDDSIPGRAEGQDVARPRFNNPHEERAAAHLKQAQEHGDSESVISRYAPKDERDLQTGFFDKSTKVETVKRAQKFAEEHNTTAHFIYADLANLGGINEHFENDNDKADLIFRAEADIFRQEVERYSPDAVFKRTGGDELGATVIGATTEELQAAAEQTRIKMLEYARKNGLVDIPRKAMRDKEGNVLPSDPRSPFGIGMYIGIAEIKPKMSLDEIFSKASEGMNTAKMRGRNGLLYGTTDQQTEGLGKDGRNGTLDRRPRGVRGSVESAQPADASQNGQRSPGVAEVTPGLEGNTQDTGRAGANPAGNESGQASTVKAPSKKPHQETLAEYSSRKRKQFNIAEGEAENRDLALEHLDHTESALEEGYKVQPSVLAGHADIDAKEYPRIAKLRGIAPQKSEALTDDKPGNEAAGQIQSAIEQLIRNRKTAGQFGLAPNLDAVIRAAKAYLKGEKFNKSLFVKTANKFQRHDAGIATILRSIVDAAQSGPKETKPQRPSTDLVGRVRQLGGINSSYLNDIVIDPPANIRMLFGKNGLSPDDMVSLLEQSGFVMPEGNKPEDQLREMLGQYVEGKRDSRPETMEENAAAIHADAATMEMYRHAESLGVKIKGRSDQEIADAIYEAEDVIAMAKLDGATEQEAVQALESLPYDVPFGDEVETDNAALAAWLGEEDGKNDQANSGNIEEGSRAEPQKGTGRSSDNSAQSQAAAGEVRADSVLKSYTNSEVIKREAAAKAAEEAVNKEAPSKNVTSDQVDMFNTQGGLFNQPAAANPVISKDGAIPYDSDLAKSKQEGFTVRFGGKRYPIESLKEASDKWVAFRAESNGGASEVGNGVPVFNKDGKQVAHISYNGRIWSGVDELSGYPDDAGNVAGTIAAPVLINSHADLKAAEKQVNTNPTDAQKEAGNYAKAHIQWNGLDITIENPAGSERSGTDSDGKKWSVTMPASYGYIKRTEGADGEHVDVYIGKHHNSEKVFVIDQIDLKTGKFDEHKNMLGFDTLREAERIYKAGFSDGKGAQRMGNVSVMSLDEFKAWLADGDTTKPAAVDAVLKPEVKSEQPAGAPVKPPNPDQAAIDKADADFADALGDLGDIIGKNLRATLTPEQEQKLLPVLTKLFDAAFRKGYYKFKDAARFVLGAIKAKFGEEVTDQISIESLQGAYIGMSGRYKERGADKAKDVIAVESKDDIGESDVTDKRSSTNLERDSQDTDAENGMGAQGVRAGRGGNGGAGRSGVQGAAESGGPRNSGIISGREASATGNDSDSEIYTGAAELSPGSAGNSVDQRSDSAGIEGAPIEPETTSITDELAESGLSLEKAKIKQLQADKKEHKPGIENIRITLPVLTEGQQEDVHTAETRFTKPDGYGMLFTNGTGTGKTFTGLGVIKRFVAAGKNNIIIAVPNDKIASDWQKSGKLLGLDISRLDDTKSAGMGVVITTYANFGQNNELASRDWDLVVTDEAHYLAMDKNGTNTLALHALRAITLHPAGASTRATMLHADLLSEMKSLEAEAKMLRTGDNQDEWAMAGPIQDKADKLRKEYQEKLEVIRADVKAKQGAARPRALFLSATPFAYEKTVDWANGYLFDYNEGKGDEGSESRGYNAGSNSDQFMMQHFGYRMRYGKLTQPDAKVDSGLMQRQFNSFLKKRGVLSGRMLDVKADYDRRFILVESAIGQRIDAALQWFEDQRKQDTQDKNPEGKLSVAMQANPRSEAISQLRDTIGKKFDYLSRRYLLEAIKAQEVIPHVKEHLALGRKVVVFHDYKKGGGFNPFDISNITETSDNGVSAAEYNAVVDEFRDEFEDLIDSDVWRASSPITAFKQQFPGVLLFNGDIPAAQRRANVEKFQDDASGPQVFLVQSAAGKEGISLHDTTGKYQRVLFNLGQPTQPTTAIQQEGRIYRTGQVTDAIFRYLNTGTNWEKWAFATTIAQRASAAENLGMGELARALKDAFIAGFEESDNYRAGMEGEGKGGKERDKAANNALTEYDRARAFYFGTQKKNSRTKSQEGTDYFATPEPVGLKMVELADIRSGESMLEPSAGHGAIARWMPTTVEKTAVEPSSALRARLAMVFDGRMIDTDFESLHVSNKYDAIVMNPPFGSGGRTAIDHLAKAVTHLRDGGRVVALIPTGPAADKKFEKWFYEEETKPVKPLFTRPDFGPIFRGDTITFDAFGSTQDVVVWNIDDNGSAQYARAKGDGVASGINLVAAKSIKPTGARTESYNAVEGFEFVADIKLPQVTFERAGTAVATRIVVIEKATNTKQMVRLDYSGETDINELFDRMENLSIAPRAKVVDEPSEVATETPARKAKPVVDQVAAQAAAQDAGLEIVEHTTGKGKVLRGVIRKDISLDQAKAIDKYTFRKDGGFFIREAHLVPPVTDAPKLSRAQSYPELAAALDQYEDTGELATVSDLANEVQRLIDEDIAPDSLQAAVDTYRDELAYDDSLKGRGDMDSADEQFIDAVRAALAAKQSISTKPLSNPQTVESVTKSTQALRNRWTGFRNIKIVQSVKEVPNDIYLRALRALKPIDQGTEGIYDPASKTVYLIADNLASPERAIWVAAHEVVGHGGIRMLGGDVAAALNHAAKNGFVAQLAKAIAVDRKETYNKDEHVDEAIAELAAATITGNTDAILDRYGVKVPMGMRSNLLGMIKRVVDAIRKFFAQVSKKPEAEVTDSEILGLLRQMKAKVEGNVQEAGQGNTGLAMASTNGERGRISGEAFARMVIEEFVAENDSAFSSPVSNSKSLDGVMSDVMSESVYHGEHTREDERAETGADHRFVFATKEGKTFYVYEKDDGELWIDVSRLDTGGSGQKIYAAVANYAYNTHKQFIGDPFGLSPKAVIRRTTNMLSSALRFGTTRHLEAAKQQVWGDPENGVEPLDWSGSDVDKVEALIHTFVTTMQNLAPKIKEYHYDFQTAQFSDAQGRPVTGATMAANTPRDAGIGEKTARRIVLLQSLISERSGDLQARRSGILEQLLHWGDTGSPGNLNAIFSRRAEKDDVHGNRAGNAESKRILREGNKGGIENDISLIDKVVRAPFKILQWDRLVAKPLDRLLEKTGEIIPETIKAGIVSNYGLESEYIDSKDDMRAREAAMNRKAHGMVEMLSGLNRAESRVAYYWMQEKPGAFEQKLMEQLPEASRKTLNTLKTLISDMGKEAVRLGQMSPDAYERNNMAYLHRTYAKHVLAEEGKFSQFMRARAVKIKGNQYKGRGIFDEVGMDQVAGDPAAWRKLQQGRADKSLVGETVIRFERRDASTEAMDALPGMTSKPMGKLREVIYWPASTPVPQKFGGWVNAGTFNVRDTKGDKLVLWRDLTREERDHLGELDEVRYAVAQTLQLMIHDIEVGRFLEWTAKEYGRVNPEGKEVTASESMLKAYHQDEWVQVPASNIPDTKTKKYGALSGMYVPGSIWNDIRQTAGGRIEPLGKTYASVLRFWKKSKTVWSPGVHTNNIMGNFVMADWHDMRAVDLADALRVWVMNDKPGYKELFERFQDSGALGGMFMSNEVMREEIKQRLEEMKADLKGEQDASKEIGTMAKVLQLVSLATVKPVKGYANVMAKAYQSEDEVFRLAMFLKAIRHGKPDIEAGRMARHAFLNYDINAPWIQAARQTALPFVSFFYRAAPMMLDTAQNKPWKIAKLVGFAYLVNALGYAMTGGDEDKDRKLMPDEKSGRLLGLVPKMIRMPWNNENDAPIFLDVRRWVPVGDIADMEMGAGMLPPWATPGGPLVSLIEAAMFNKSMFTKQDIVKETDTLSEETEKRIDYLFKSMMPNIPLPNPVNMQFGDISINPFNLDQGSLQSYSWSGIEKAVDRKENKIGEVRTTPQAIVNSFGVKIGSYPHSNMKAAIGLSFKRDIAEMTGEANKALRNFANIENPTAAQRAAKDREVERLRNKMKTAADRVREKVD